MNEEIINFYSENEFELRKEYSYRNWLKRLIASEGKKLGEISFVFCNDAFLLEINQKYLNHDTYTDIISFDNSVGGILYGELYISTERLMENAEIYKVAFPEELKRVLAHGLLHLCGYKDKTEDESKEMRRKEEEKMKMFHVEQ